MSATPDLDAPPPLDVRTAALFTDLDGTLARLQPAPGLVGPDAARRKLLEGLRQALDGRLAVVSGRGLADLDRILEGSAPALAAVHGLVRRDALGRTHQAPTPPGLADARASVEAFARADRKLSVEDKGPAVALHYRASPGAEEACQDLAHRLALSHDLRFQQGDMVVELRAAGPDKGDAVLDFMAEPPFVGAVPVFLGDDLTDEDGFAAASALGGYGVIVGARRPTAAKYALADVDAAADWLGRAVRKPA